MLMFAHGGSMNRGCEAIVRSSTDMIKRKLEGATVYLASAKPQSDRFIHSLDGIYDAAETGISKYSFHWLLSAVHVKLFHDESYALARMNHKLLHHMKPMDICLSIGGDNYCYGEQPGLYEVNRRAKMQGKALVLWGCSIGEEDMSARKLEDLQSFDLILARETLTYDMLRSKGLMQVKLCADPAFTLAGEELPLPGGWQAGNTVGLNFSPLVLLRNPSSADAVRHLITHILQTTDMAIALTPHVIEEGNNDYKTLFSFHEQFKHTGRVLLLPDHLNAMQYKGYISRMRFFIGARTHATIAAYSSGVPTMALGYSVKSKGISQDLFHRERLVMSIRDLSDSRKLQDMFDEMVAEEQDVRERLAAAIPVTQALSYKAVDDLKEVI